MQPAGHLKHWLKVLLTIAVCGSCFTRAAVVENLYTATVDRPTDVQDERAAVQAAAMSQVLVRVTGDRAAAVAPELSLLLDNPSEYQSTYGLLSTTEAQVEFVPERIERELAIAGWPVWGAERPQSMLWIAVTDQFEEQAILTANGPPEDAEFDENMIELLATIRDEIETITQQRGLPFVLPTFATHEDMLLAFEQVWTYSFDGLSEVSSAWDADAMVIGRVRESVIGTDVEWLIRSAALGLALSYPGTGVPEGIHWLADEYARLYVTRGGPRPMILRVAGISSFDTYARVLAYLESVTILSQIDVESWNGSELVLRCESRGDADVLSRTFGLDSVLRVRRPTFNSGFVPTLQYDTAIDLEVVPERNVFSGFEPSF